MEKMGERVRLSNDILRPFMGEGDVVTWLNNLKLVAKLQKIEVIVTLILMYLVGNVLTVHLEMGEKDQADAESIEKRLKTAFSEGTFEAYKKLRKVTWIGESVDIYAAEIRRLAGLIRYSWSGASNIRAVDCGEVKCCGETDAKIMVRNIPLQFRVTVLDKLAVGINVILGLDAIDWLGGATIAKGQVKFGNQYITKMARGANSNDTIPLTKPRPCQIKDEDF